MANTIHRILKGKQMEIIIQKIGKGKQMAIITQKTMKEKLTENIIRNIIHEKLTDLLNHKKSAHNIGLVKCGLKYKFNISTFYPRCL